MSKLLQNLTIDGLILIAFVCGAVSTCASCWTPEATRPPEAHSTPTPASTAGEKDGTE